MVGRLGTQADILITESVLGRILETVDSMLIETPLVGIMLSGERMADDEGQFILIKGLGDEGPVGMCFSSSEGGTEPIDNELSIFKSKLETGVLMKVDVFSHQFSVYKVGDCLEDAKVLFVE